MIVVQILYIYLYYPSTVFNTNMHYIFTAKYKEPFNSTVARKEVFILKIPLYPFLGQLHS